MSKLNKETPKFDYVAAYNVGGESTMELFHGLDHEGWVSDNFISEFKWLEQHSSSIKIYINSVGGSVVNGLNVFSTILNSSIPTTAVVTGIAASMASVIALAADTLVMNDYSLLMWHLPYSPSGEAEDDQLKMFSKMLSKIYQERLNKTEEEILAFMEGEEGKDGTWFDATTALELGIISEIISTGTQKSLIKDVDELEAKFDASEVATKLHSIASSLNSPKKKNNKKENKDNSVNGTADVVVAKKSVPKQKKKNTMDLTNISASLGIKNATEEAIEARVNEIVANNKALKKEVSEANKDLVAKGKSLTDSGIELAAVEAKLATSEAKALDVEAKVEGLEAKISAFEAEKAEAQTKNIEAIVNQAVKDGKISSDAEATWTGLLSADFDGASKALESLSVSNGGKVKLSNVVKESEAKVEAEVEDTSHFMSMKDTMAKINKDNK